MTAFRNTTVWAGWAGTAVILLLWEFVGRAELVGGGALPSITAIAESWWHNRADFPPHVWATLRVALLGWLYGNAVAVLLAVSYQLLPGLERILRTTVVVLFCLPVVVAAPILGIALSGDWPKIVLAMLLVFFPTLIATHLGLSNTPGDTLSVVESAGGGIISQLVLVRIRSALPDVVAGLQIAAPAAVLGALLGEFLGGRYGLGIYLIGAMGRADAPILWAIGLTATALSAGLYVLIGLAAKLAGIEPTQPTLDVRAASVKVSGSFMRKALVQLGWTLAGFAALIGLWYAAVSLTGLPTVLMNTPAIVAENLLWSPRAANNRAALSEAIGTSLGPAVVGSAVGIAVALLLAVVFSTWGSASRAVMPFLFISQTVPLVALAPLIALTFGRGTLTTVLVTVSVTFFPSLVTIMQGIAATPSGPRDVLASVNAGRIMTLTAVILPSTMPHLLASVRLAVPRALTGVLIAEQFITGQGLGGLLGTSRGFLDYQMMWLITAVVTGLSVLAYALAQAAETAVLNRRR